MPRLRQTQVARRGCLPAKLSNNGVFYGQTPMIFLERG